MKPQGPSRPCARQPTTPFRTISCPALTPAAYNSQPGTAPQAPSRPRDRIVPTAAPLCRCRSAAAKGH
ncbi:hypothetical protein NDU88_004272 [Pleurodeles waltl]|uniref:Uncharacterized protein n=1 Tax=Pleurodeles waltl TaxID=8319 RepID=A0AAV7LU60_PLEWA|nr:hypothetical protein NDU88_004272 [Pleurodeles waltl]